MTGITNKSKLFTDMMKFTFHHKAFYCYLGLSVWIFIIITAMYKYMSVSEEIIPVKKLLPSEHISKSDSKFRRIYLKACNPPDNIVRGSEGVVDTDTWLLQGVLVITRHGDRGPLTHLRGGDKLPCDTTPVSPLLKSYEQWVSNASVGGRAWWVSGAGPFHNFPARVSRAPATSCALGQLTPTGLLQMITVGNILREAYADKLGLGIVVDPQGKHDAGEFVSYSTRYRRTYQSLCGALFGVSARGAGARAAAARESHSVAYCFRECACAAQQSLNKKIASQNKKRLDAHPAIKDLVSRLSKVLFETQEYIDGDVVRDALLAYMCHDAPLPCSDKPTHIKNNPPLHNKYKKFRDKNIALRNLLEADSDGINMELDYLNQIDFNNEIGRKARDIVDKYDKDKDNAPLDFDAQMEREKLLYYQQRYMDNVENYDDVVIVKKNIDADFNFPNDARMDEDFDEDYKEPTPDNQEDFCIKKEHVISLFSYLEWSYKQEMRNIHKRRKGLLTAYGLIHNIVQNMIRMISDNKPKFVFYSGHDKTLQPLVLALGLNNHQNYNIQYASRMVFEVYRKKDLLDEFKFTKRKAIAQDFFFRVVYNGEDVTNKLSFCKSRNVVVMKVNDPIDDMKAYNTCLCPIESIVRFIHDDYFSPFNVSNFKDACASYGGTKRVS